MPRSALAALVLILLAGCGANNRDAGYMVTFERDERSPDVRLGCELERDMCKRLISNAPCDLDFDYCITWRKL